MASWKDILSDYVANDRTLGNLGDITVIYNYGFLFTYGIGFGFPLLLGLPDQEKSCGRHDFLDTLAQYDLQVNFYQIITLWLIETQSGRVNCDNTKRNNLPYFRE